MVRCGGKISHGVRPDKNKINVVSEMENRQSDKTVTKNETTANICFVCNVRTVMGNFDRFSDFIHISCTSVSTPWLNTPKYEEQRQLWLGYLKKGRKKHTQWSLKSHLSSVVWQSSWTNLQYLVRCIKNCLGYALYAAKDLWLIASNYSGKNLTESHSRRWFLFTLGIGLYYILTNARFELFISVVLM